MLNLDSISISVREVDISDMVTGVTIQESIMGMLKGAIAVKDGINFFDEFIGTDLADVQFSYEYIGETKIASFYMDGISNMKIEKQQKNYIIHIASMHESAFAQKINNAFREVSKTQSKKVLEITSEKLVSIDFNHNSSSAIIDSSLTSVVGKNMGKISAWYDNECGFSNRMCDIAEYVNKIS